MNTRRISALCGLILAAFVVAAPAHAKEFSLPEAKVVARVLPTGAVHVTERLTYSFVGDFQGAYREIPLRISISGQTTLMSISDVSVAEGGIVYSPGASAELGSSGAPATFGVANLGDRYRIVWHYRASTELRTFEVSYTLNGLPWAYTDVVDVNLRVWGEEWDVGLNQLSAKVVLPEARPGQIRVWGHPATVAGFTELLASGKGARLTAADVPPHTWVEMRVVFPRDVLPSAPLVTPGAGTGLPKILEEENALAASAERDRARVEWLKSNLAWLVPLGLVVAVAPAGVIGYRTWSRYGREPAVTAMPEHLPEPPGDDAPALVAALLEPGSGRVRADAFTATMFDLIRRRCYEVIPTTTERKTWAGLRTQTVDDLVISRSQTKSPMELPGFELTVHNALSFAMTGESQFKLSQLRDKIGEHPTKFKEFLDGSRRRS